MSGPEAGTNASGPRHEHRWSMVRFELADGHPVVDQHCETCGLVRRHRAWERYWDPAAAPGPGLTEPGSRAKHPSPAVAISFPDEASAPATPLTRS